MIYLLWKNGDYDPASDVLVRAYRNQEPNPKDDELFCGEVLFRPHMNRKHERFSAPFPRGVARACAQVVRGLSGDVNVQVSNELNDHEFHLTSCDKHFEKRFRQVVNGGDG